MFPRLKTWDSNKDEKVSRALWVTLEYSLTLSLTREYPKIADARVLANTSRRESGLTLLQRWFTARLALLFYFL